MVVMDDDETIILEDIETRINNVIFMISDMGIIHASNSYGSKWTNYT